jgi:galactose oxidase
MEDPSMHMVESDANALSIGAKTVLPRDGWTVTASDSQTTYPATNVLDGNNATIWHSNYATTPNRPLPHWLVLDMKQVRTISELDYLPRQSGVNGQIGRYQLFVSLDGTNWGAAVATGTWGDDPATGAKPWQFAEFGAVPARFVKLVALTEAGNRGPWSSIAELKVLGSTNNYMAMPRDGWTVTASDSQTAYPATNALDESNRTIWHSNYATTPNVPLPHTLTIDMHTTHVLRGLSYLPRQDGIANGRIGSYQVAVSANGTTWQTVKNGAWADDAAEKAAVFSPVQARYVRLTALTEAGDRGPWSSAANIELYDTLAVPPLLSRSGWTATASDAAPNYPVSNLLDGNSKTIWHSNYATNPDVPLPHTVTIDMKQTTTVSGLSYQPRQDNGVQENGTIGSYKIRVSTNGTTWSTVASGDWSDNLAIKTARFNPVTVRYIQLTALTEAGNRGPWSAASELYVLGVAPTAANGGMWSEAYEFPLVPTMAAVLPNNKLLIFSAYSTTNFNRTPDAITKVAIMDLATGVISQPANIDTDHQMFCSGLALLADGRLLINGGSGDSATTIYNPFTDTWTKGPLMTTPRAYQATTLLSDGRVFTLGGSWDDPGNTGAPRNGEVFTASGSTGFWQALSGVDERYIMTADPAGRYRADNHAWLFAASNGTVFHAGPSKQMNWISTAGNGSITSAGLRGTSADAMNGTAVMYDVNKILTMGGAAVYQDAGSVFNAQAYRTANLINISGGFGTMPSVTQAGSMAYQRAFGGSIALPDGSVLVVGGQQHPEPFTDTAPATSPELWSPSTNSFRVMAPEAMPRTYHSVALLLPDGRVFSGGGGLCGSCTTNHTSAQIYTPPYLLNPDGSLRARPAITAAPTTITHGSSISVSTTTPVTNFALVRMSATTHTVNTDQRRIPVSFSAAGTNTYSLAVPRDSGVVLPGYYMLFALDANGTPSVAKVVKIS